MGRGPHATGWAVTRWATSLSWGWAGRAAAGGAAPSSLLHPSLAPPAAQQVVAFPPLGTNSLLPPNPLADWCFPGQAAYKLPAHKLCPPHSTPPHTHTTHTPPPLQIVAFLDKLGELRSMQPLHPTITRK